MNFGKSLLLFMLVCAICWFLVGLGIVVLSIEKELWFF